MAAAPLGAPPQYARAGSILPMGGPIQDTREKADAEIDLRIYQGASVSFTLYDYDGTTYDYEKGAYSTVPIHWDDATRTYMIGLRHGTFPGMTKNRTFNIIWVGEGHGDGVSPTEPVDDTVHYDGQPITVKRKLAHGG